MKFRRFVVTGILAIGLILSPLSIATMPALAAPATGNTLAICGCGKIFTPSGDTKYLEHQGVRYACCSDGCHGMAEKNPAKAAKMAKINTVNAAARVEMPIYVANVIAVGTDGAKALCGCGGTAVIGAKTAYIEANGKTYAACSEKCSEHQSKDLAKAAELIEAKLAKHHHSN